MKCDLCCKEKDDFAWDEVQACFECTKLLENRKDCKHLDDLDKIGSFFYTKLGDGTFSLGTMDINEPMVGVRFCPFCGVELK